MPIDSRQRLSDEELEVLLRSWWSANISATPPAIHTVRSHVAWAQWLQQQGAGAQP